MQQNLVTQEMLDAFNAAIEAKIAAAQTALINEAFPIGKVIPQMQGEPEPGSYIPGTSWELVPDYAGKVVVGSGDSYTLGATGGSANNTHNHEKGTLYAAIAPGDSSFLMRFVQGVASYGTQLQFAAARTDQNANSTFATDIGGSTAQTSIDTMPPYVVANYWKRIA